MSSFRRITDSFWVSPQIGGPDVAKAAREGFALLINNRPDDEEPGQPSGDDIARAAAGAGIAYRAIPISGAGFGIEQVEAMRAQLMANTGMILAFCRSGTRSTLLWALAQAALGEDPDAIAAQALAAGYDVGPVRAAMNTLAARPAANP